MTREEIKDLIFALEREKAQLLEYSSEQMASASALSGAGVSISVLELAVGHSGKGREAAQRAAEIAKRITQLRVELDMQ